MKDIDELDALHAAAWPGPWTSETWEVECGARDGCPAGDDCEGSHDCETILAPEAYPDGQVVAQTSHADGRIRAPGLEQFARANTAAIVALKNNWPAISARLRAAEAAVERLRGALFPIATGRFASVSEACDLAEDALGSAAVAEWNAVENARAALGEP